jgi:lipopolysaccharide biosynthesis glycosyltransferase
MINFLLIGDKNYNLQLVNSINSLVDNFNLNYSGSTVYVIHKNPNSFKRYLKYINCEKVKIIKFNKEFRVLNNVKKSHLSEVTYYRLYLDKLLDIKEGFLIYFDADLYFMNDINKFLENSIKHMRRNNQILGAVKEDIITELNIEYFQRLQFKDKPYFNAGFIIFNIKICNEIKLFQNLRTRLQEIDFDLKYWDQDILNSVVNGEFYQLDEKINSGVDLTNKNPIKGDALAIHYKGKNKPWDMQYAFDEKSIPYQELHSQNFNTYHLANVLRHPLKLVKLKLSLKSIFKIIKLRVINIL